MKPTHQLITAIALFVFVFCGAFCCGMAYGSIHKKECLESDYYIDLKTDFLIVKSENKIDTVKLEKLQEYLINDNL